MGPANAIPVSSDARRGRALDARGLTRKSGKRWKRGLANWWSCSCLHAPAVQDCAAHEEDPW
jgi:hypothetical protein